MTLWRLQDRQGRGPFRPGFSQHWLDAHAPDRDFPPIYEALGVKPGDLWRLLPQGMHCGCACRSREQLTAWFNRNERRRLVRYGYGIVVFEPDVVVRDLEHQTVFAMRRPLSELPQEARYG